jgi:hypothetical protein
MLKDIFPILSSINPYNNGIAEEAKASWVYLASLWLQNLLVFPVLHMNRDGNNKVQSKNL